MDTLINILKQFDAKRDGQGKHDDYTIAECFMPIAEQILLGGCLYVNCNHPFKIDIKTIELYYHEEKNGGFKDPIMYHTNWRVPKNLKERGVLTYPYYQFGCFNLHTSGLDITFENPVEQYRASFLIRAYRVLEADEDPNTSTKPFDKCSTHIFDDLFPEGVSAETLAKIEWREEKKEGTIEQTPRQNVCLYDTIEGEAENYKKREGTKCLKPWRFDRV